MSELSLQPMLGYPTARTGLETGLRIHTRRIIETLGNADSTLLDVGCGTGEYINSIVSSNSNYRGVGVDVNSVFIRERRASLASFAIASAEYLPFRKNSFNAVFMIESLEHVRDEVRVLHEISEVLEEAGFLYISVPNRLYPLESHGIIIGHRTFERAFPVGVPLVPYLPRRIVSRIVRARTYTTIEIFRLLSEAGWVITNSSIIMPPIDRKMPTGLTSLLRRIVTRLERTPVLNQLGSSIVLVARRRIPA